MADPIKDTRRMIAEMQPRPASRKVRFLFGHQGRSCSGRRESGQGQLRRGRGTVVHHPTGGNGPTSESRGGIPMRQITLMVRSALDGVGLTAAVSSAPRGAGDTGERRRGSPTRPRLRAGRSGGRSLGHPARTAGRSAGSDHEHGSEQASCRDTLLGRTRGVAGKQPRFVGVRSGW